jgi:hypothetical protein
MSYEYSVTVSKPPNLSALAHGLAAMGLSPQRETAQELALVSHLTKPEQVVRWGADVEISLHGLSMSLLINAPNRRAVLEQVLRGLDEQSIEYSIEEP